MIGGGVGRSGKGYNTGARGLRGCSVVGKGMPQTPRWRDMAMFQPPSLLSLECYGTNTNLIKYQNKLRDMKKGI